MNTSTRAAFKDANHAHASTARGPLLRPEGVIMPSTTTTTSQPSPRPDYDAAALAFRLMAEMAAEPEPTTSQTDALKAHELEKAQHAQTTYARTASPAAHCATLAACYREAMADPAARLPVTPALVADARAWLFEQLSAVTALGYWPNFVNRESLLSETLAAFNQPDNGQPYRSVPITSLYNNDPHPVWSPLENLLFRFVHDHHHHQVGAAADFTGELTVTRHILTPAVRANDALARFLASEPVGQSAQFIESGVYPAQVIAAGILDLI
jgi:hypothetical protein